MEEQITRPTLQTLTKADESLVAKRTLNISQPFLEFPAEILADIALIAVLSSSRANAGSSTNLSPAKRTALYLSAVCHHLRLVVVGHPLIWGFLVDFTYPNSQISPASAMEQLQVFLARSRDAPLHLEVRNHRSSRNTIMAELAPGRSSRLKMYRMTVSEKQLAKIVVEGFKREFPTLEGLHLTAPGISVRVGGEFRPLQKMDMPVQRLPPTFRAPRLKFLILSGFMVDFSKIGISVNLVQLSVRNILPLSGAPGVDMWLDVLRGTPAMRILVLQLAINPDADSASGAKGSQDNISLLRAEQVMITSTQDVCYTLLSALVLPETCGLAIEASVCVPGWKLDALLRISERQMRNTLRLAEGELQVRLKKRFLQVRTAKDWGRQGMNLGELVLTFGGGVDWPEIHGDPADAIYCPEKATHSLMDFVRPVGDGFAGLFGEVTALSLRVSIFAIPDTNGAQETEGDTEAKLGSFWSRFRKSRRVSVGIHGLTGLCHVLKQSSQIMSDPNTEDVEAEVEEIIFPSMVVLSITQDNICADDDERGSRVRERTTPASNAIQYWQGVRDKVIDYLRWRNTGPRNVDIQEVEISRRLPVDDSFLRQIKSFGATISFKKA
ncbi:unnamed protein product [Cyclocybe aegerita]|uniref:Uncharacterized protein n=1 Tax=Cyclocybe aegerita TaxID=1973307 RepID=A0A8S0WTV5_CYCAE|nr:unnamed protein product [Cyclocybe aegerita]